MPTGIPGLDEITDGGLPRGRPTLISGGPGCGKSIIAARFLAAGALDYNEPGVLVSFEENEEDIALNLAPLGIDVRDLVERGLLLIEYVYIERSEIEETGEFDLGGLFIRLEAAVREIGAKRICLDTLEALFSGFRNAAILRAEVRRLFRWLKSEGLTAVITAEEGSNGLLTRIGIEEYVSDCVIVLQNRSSDQIATRKMRVLKYRGSSHGSNEYPFLIDEGGVSVLPVTSVELTFKAPQERISTGVPSLDEMLGGKGFFRGSSIMVSGAAGTGKTTLAASFANAACARGERCLFVSYEESQDQLMRNMLSVGVDLGHWVKKGLLHFHTARSTLYGLENHLVMTHRLVTEIEPTIVTVDPLTDLQNVGVDYAVKNMAERMVAFLKGKNITTYMTHLAAGPVWEPHDVGISSAVDTWLSLRALETDGERNRALCILKSRGMEHSNQVREFVFTSKGIQLVDVHVGKRGILTGSARLAHETRERAKAEGRDVRQAEGMSLLERRRALIEAQIAALRAEFAIEEQKLQRTLLRERTAAETDSRTRARLEKGRQS